MVTVRMYTCRAAKAGMTVMRPTFLVVHNILSSDLQAIRGEVGEHGSKAQDLGGLKRDIGQFRSVYG